MSSQRGPSASRLRMPWLWPARRAPPGGRLAPRPGGPSPHPGPGGGSRSGPASATVPVQPHSYPPVPSGGVVDGPVEDAREVVGSARRQPGLHLAIEHFLDPIGYEATGPGPVWVGDRVAPHHSAAALIGRGPHRGTTCVLQPIFEEVGNCPPPRWRDAVLRERRQGGGQLGGSRRPGPGVAIQLSPDGEVAWATHLPSARW